MVLPHKTITLTAPRREGLANCTHHKLFLPQGPGQKNGDRRMLV